MDNRTPNSGVALPPSNLIAADTTQLLAAYSFIKPFDGITDPRAEAAFQNIATAFCNGANLVLPAPNTEIFKVPLFHDLWSKEGPIQPLESLELDDAVFESTAPYLIDRFATFAEGAPDDIASWIALQFSDPIVPIHMMMSDTDSVRRAGPVVNELIDQGCFTEVRKSILRQRSEGRLKLPGEYESLEAEPETPSFVHLCIAYAFSVAIRGYTYGLRVGRTAGEPIYSHHWTRGFSLKANRELDIQTELSPTLPAVPWGLILSKAISFSGLQKNDEAIGFALESIRLRSSDVQSDFASIDAKSDSEDEGDSNRISDRELILLDALRDAGVVLPFADSTRRGQLINFLKTISKGADPLVQIGVEFVTANIQPKWLRKAETSLRVRFKRDRFWDVFDDLAIRRVADQ